MWYIYATYVCVCGGGKCKCMYPYCFQIIFSLLLFGLYFIGSESSKQILGFRGVLNDKRYEREKYCHLVPKTIFQICRNTLYYFIYIILIFDIFPPRVLYTQSQYSLVYYKKNSLGN